MIYPAVAAYPQTAVGAQENMDNCVPNISRNTVIAIQIGVFNWPPIFMDPERIKNIPAKTAPYIPAVIVIFKALLSPPFLKNNPQAIKPTQIKYIELNIELAKNTEIPPSTPTLRDKAKCCLFILISPIFSP